MVYLFLETPSPEAQKPPFLLTPSKRHPARKPTFKHLFFYNTKQSSSSLPPQNNLNSLALHICPQSLKQVSSTVNLLATEESQAPRKILN